MDKLDNFRNDKAIFRSEAFFAPSNKHIIINPRLPTGIPFDCIDGAYETNEPSIVIPGDISPQELGRWLRWVLRASIDELKMPSQKYMKYFQGVPGIQELWEEKKKLQIPCIFDLKDPEANNRDFSIIPHRNALIGWYINISIYASEDLILLYGYFSFRLSGRVKLKNFDPFIPLSADDETIGGKVLEWWRKFRNMEVDFTKLRFYNPLKEEKTLTEAVREYYEKRFGYRFIGEQVVRPSPENIPQYDPSDPLRKYNRR